MCVGAGVFWGGIARRRKAGVRYESLHPQGAWPCGAERAQRGVRDRVAGARGRAGAMTQHVHVLDGHVICE